MFYENIGVPVRSSTKYFVALGLVLLLVGMGYSVYIYKKTSSPQQEKPEKATHIVRSEIPLASSPQSSWPKLVMSAGGRTELIPVPPQMHIVMNGNDFRVHNVYQDGHECAFGESCVAGPLKGNYATNEAKGTNIISYAFAPD